MAVLAVAGGRRRGLRRSRPMTHDRDFKRLVRHRMRKTGESYASARAHLRRTHAEGPMASESSEGTAMYPFDRFTDPAKRALTRAQFEAEAGHSDSIATTHLLLGLLDDKNSMAVGILGRVAPNLLRWLFHDKARFRAAFERQPPEGPVQESEGLVPSEPVKRAIELAFADAQLVGDGAVGTGHLLLGVLRVETSSGARAMAELGVTVDQVWAKLRELSDSGVAGESSTPQRKPPDRDVTEWMEAAQVLARNEGSASVRIDHLIRAAPRSRVATELFQRLGIDLPDALAAVPRPPAELSEAEASLVELVSLRRQGARERIDPPVQGAGRSDRRVDDAERSAREERDRIYGEWIRLWGSSARGSDFGA